MDLLRLPLVVLREVFKNMNFDEIYSISLLSKRARNTLKLMSVPSKFSIDFSHSLTIRVGTHTQDSENRVLSVKDYYMRKEKMVLMFITDGVNLLNRSPPKQLMLVNHILDTFKCSLITIWFYDGVLPSTALEFMKMVNQRELRIKSFYCHIKSESSELIPRILDECSEVTDSILVSAAVPDDFVYTPSRPFKAKSIDVRFRTNWLKLDSCMSCRNASVELGENSNRTAEIYDSFFNKWMDSNAQLQSLMLSSIEKHEYQMIMNALSNQGTKRTINDYWFEIKRRDGSEFFIFTFNRYIRIYTKQAYLGEKR